MTTEQQKVAFLLETEAELLGLQVLTQDDDTVESACDLPPYVTNYIGSKQKLTDWVWAQTPDGIDSVLDAFSGSAVVAYMFKTKGLKVIANDRLYYCFHNVEECLTGAGSTSPIVAGNRPRVETGNRRNAARKVGQTDRSC